MKKLNVLFVSFLAAIWPARANVTLPAFFSDHMVLQQGTKIPIWGSADPGEQITVSLGNESASATADGKGKWRADLPPAAASATPMSLTVAGKDTRVISDVLIGEVWICSGQSNMERQLGPRGGQPEITNWKEEAADGNYPLIRHFGAAHIKAEQPAADLPGKWEVCSPEAVIDFTAVGFFFARDLQKDIKVPIGLIHTSWGGTPAEAWTPHETMMGDSDLRAEVEKYEMSVADYPARLAQYQKDESGLLAKYTRDAEEAKAAGKPEPRRPAPPADPRQRGWEPGVLYNGMIAPLVPYAMRGVIWYQGESNNGNAKIYQKLFPAMIASWRQAWGVDFPFLFVQIAPFPGIGPEIREAQFLTWKKTPGTAMAVITDHGYAANVHPPDKRPVGERLALAARALAYGEKIEYSGPEYESMRVEGGAIKLSFAHEGGGLVAKDGPLKGFTIAGADGKFVPAQAEIQGESVIVSSPDVPRPVAARYGWANFPEVNLFNKAGLPASPFRTDTD